MIIEILIVFIKYLITGILPILAILLTWLTLREMQIQRRQSYIPDIMVKNCYKYMIVDKISDNIYFSDNKENEVENIEDIPKGFELNILNIGMGTAKNVNVNFEILNIEFLISKIEGCAFQKEGKFTYFKALNKSYYFNESLVNNYFFTYILNIEKETSFKKIFIPFYLFDIIYSIIFINKNNEEEMNKNFENNIEVLMNISFEDISGNIYKKVKKLQVDVVSIDIKKDINIIMFEVKEKNNL